MSGVAQRVGGDIALLFLDCGTRSGWVVSSTPRRILPQGKTRYLFYRRLGGPQGRSGQAEILVPTGIEYRTVQPVVSRYTDWATGLAIWLKWDNLKYEGARMWIELVWLRVGPGAGIA